MANFKYYLFASIINVLCFKSSCVFKPRGVPLLKTIFYDASQDFNCLDGSGKFPFHFVNDDFCDCLDGSDEPGTAACDNGKFVCANYGHISQIIPSSRVNDGICDCCDTSDEYESAADCFNHCKELGLKAVSEAKKIQEEYINGNQTRLIYISEANKQKDVLMKSLNKLMDTERKTRKIKIKKEELKKEAENNENLYLGLQKKAKEEQEKRRLLELKILNEQKIQDEMSAKAAFSELDINNDGKVIAAEVRSFPRFDYDNDGIVSEKEAQFFMHKEEELTLEKFIQTGWPKMKSAFINEEVTANYENIDFNPKFAPTSISKDTDGDCEYLKIDENKKNAAFEDAANCRKEYADAEKALQDIQAEIWLLKKKLNADYGRENEYFVLQNQCFDFSDKRYLYRLCPFDKAVQIMKHNNDETLLGLWDSWTGRGNKYSQMSYTRGLTCWNGPARSTLVNLQCGTENKVLSLIEHSPCQYLFEFATPASCSELPTHVKDVLQQHAL